MAARAGTTGASRGSIRVMRRLARLVALAALALPLPACARRRVFARPDPIVAEPGPRIPAALVPYVEAISDQVTSGLLHNDGSEEYDYQVYERLARRLDRDTARALLAHPSPAIRAWMIQHVTDQLPGEIEGLAPLARDTARFETQDGLQLRQLTVGAWLVEQLHEHRRWAPLARIADDAAAPIEVRASALEAISGHDPACVERLAPALLGGPPAARIAALRAVARAKLRSAFALAEPHLASADEQVRRAAFDALAIAREPAAAAALLPFTASPHHLAERVDAVVAYLASDAADRVTADTLLAHPPRDWRTRSRSLLLASVARHRTTSGWARLAAEPEPARSDAIRELLSMIEPDREWALRTLAHERPSAGPSPASRRVEITAAAIALGILARAPEPTDLKLARAYATSADDTEQRSALALILAVGEPADLRPLLTSYLDQKAARRLFWLRDSDAILPIRAAAATADASSAAELRSIADDLTCLRDGTPPAACADSTPPPRVRVSATTPDCHDVANAGELIEDMLPPYRRLFREQVAHAEVAEGDVELSLTIDRHADMWWSDAGKKAAPGLPTLARRVLPHAVRPPLGAGVCATTLHFRIVR